MDIFALFFTLEAIGISITMYLIRKRRAAEQPVCPIGKDCSKVLTSKYNHVFFIHNDVAGFLFYLTSGIITALLLLEVGPTDLMIQALALMLLAASIMAVYFTYVQWRLLKAWCFWCVVSALIVWGMTVLFSVFYSIN